MNSKFAIAAVAFVTASGLVFAHNCPYEWNIRLAKGIEFKETPLSSAVDQINAAVRVATKGRIPKAIILDTTPVTITKENSDPEIILICIL